MKPLLGFLLVVVVALVAFVATRPGAFHIERSAVIAAPPTAVQAHVEDFRAWTAWSPWEKLDPSMKKTFAGPPTGVGAVYAWVGNDQVGEGRQTITDVIPGERVGIRLDLLKPWAATSATGFTFEPDEGGTRVTWTMDGKSDFLEKAMGLFMDMDQMVGRDYEKGLANLKAVVESAAGGLSAAVDSTGAAR